MKTLFSEELRGSHRDYQRSHREEPLSEKRLSKGKEICMQITYYGHSVFLFEIDEHSVLIDPFIQDNPLCPVQLEEVLARNVEVVLVTHAHADHWGNTIDFARAGALVV